MKTAPFLALILALAGLTNGTPNPQHWSSVGNSEWIVQSKGDNHITYVRSGRGQNAANLRSRGPWTDFDATQGQIRQLGRGSQSVHARVVDMNERSSLPEENRNTWHGYEIVRDTSNRNNPWRQEDSYANRRSSNIAYENDYGRHSTTTRRPRPRPQAQLRSLDPYALRPRFPNAMAQAQSFDGFSRGTRMVRTTKYGSSGINLTLGQVIGGWMVVGLDDKGAVWERMENVGVPEDEFVREIRKFGYSIRI